MRPLLRSLYPVGVLLVFMPLFDLVTTAWPLQPGSIQWRYGFLGLLGNFVLTPLLGAALASLAAAGLRHTLTLRVLSVVWAVGAVGLGVGLVLFGLDVVQLRAQLQNQHITNYRASAAIAGMKYVTGMIALGWIALAGLQTARKVQSEPKVKDPEAANRVVRSTRPS